MSHRVNLHDHLVPPKAQGFSGALHDDRGAHSSEDIGLPLFGRVEDVAKHVVVVRQLRIAGRAYSLAGVFTCEADADSTVATVMVAAMAGECQGRWKNRSF